MRPLPGVHGFAVSRCTPRHDAHLRRGIDTWHSMPVYIRPVRPPAIGMDPSPWNRRPAGAVCCMVATSLSPCTPTRLHSCPPSANPFVIWQRIGHGQGSSLLAPGARCGTRWRSQMQCDLFGFFFFFSRSRNLLACRDIENDGENFTGHRRPGLNLGLLVDAESQRQLFQKPPMRIASCRAIHRIICSMRIDPAPARDPTARKLPVPNHHHGELVRTVPPVPCPFVS